MWKRRTFHDCADELITVSEDFRAAYTNKFPTDEQRRNRTLQNTSERGVEILRILALSIRSEQDFGISPKIDGTVEALKSAASAGDIFDALNSYSPPYNAKSDFKALGLRDALNKIAHASPGKNSFYADEFTHDIIL